MNRKIVDYTVIAEHNKDVLVSKVCDLIKGGYEPIGGVQMVAPVLNSDEVAPLYAQAMVRPE